MDTAIAANTAGSGLLKFVFPALLALLVGLGAWFYFFVKSLKKEEKKKTMLKYVFMIVRVPFKNEIPPRAMEQVFSSISSLYQKQPFWKKWFSVPEPISFEIIGYKDYIGFFVYTPAKYAQFIEKQILGAYPDAEVYPVKEPIYVHSNAKMAGGFLTLTNPKKLYPIKTYSEWDKEHDPLSTVVGAFANMADGEGAGLQVLVVPKGQDWASSVLKNIEGEEKKKYDKPAPDDKKPVKMKLTDTQMEYLKRKISKVGLDVHIRILTSANTQQEADARLQAIAGSFAQFTNPGLQGFKLKKVEPKKMHSFLEDFFFRRVPDQKPMVLNAEELATIYHYPNKLVDIPGIDWAAAKTAPPPHDLPSKGVLWLGTAIYRGQKRPVYFASIDDRRRHMYIIGQTGTGKSWFLANMILQDMYAGRGLAVLDPHGSLIELILDRIPPNRVEDVIYFNVADKEYPMGFNILEHRNEFEKHEIVNGLLALMKKLFDPHDQGIVGPRFERAVRMAMLTVMVDPRSTLVEVLRAIHDENFARSFLPRIKDPEIINYYQSELAKTDRFHKSEILGWITSKFDRFVTNLLIRSIIGQSKSSFDVRKVMDEGKILLVNLSQGLIGVENAQFLGLLIVPKIMRAALSREDIPEKQRRDFFLYVDEFQNFATEDFAKILSEARKYRLSLIVANQYISQMTEKVRDAVFGNVGNLSAFRVGASDAEYLEKEFAPIFTKEDLVQIPNINCYIKMLINGKVTKPFSMNTYFEIDKLYPVHKGVREKVIQIARTRYARPFNEVIQEIDNRAKQMTGNRPPAITSVGKPPLTM